MLSKIRVRRISAAATAILALMGIFAYLPGMRILGSIRPDYIPMAPSTALLFLIFAGALIFAYTPNKKIRNNVFFPLTLFALAFALLEVAGYVTGMDLNWEHHIVPEFGTLNGIPMARMSPSTGLFFFIAGLGFLPIYAPGISLQETHKKTTTGICGTILLVGSLTFLLGYLYGTPLLYGRKTIPMALTTTLGFMFLSAGAIELAGKDRFPIRMFYGPSAYARLMRVFLPLAVGAVLVHSFFTHFLPLFVDFNDAWAVVLLAVIIAFVTAIAVDRTSRWIGDQMDHSEKELQQSREKYRSLFSSIRDAIVVANTKRRIVNCNPAFTELFGYTEQEIIGKPTIYIYESEAEFADLGEKLAENIDNPDFLHTVSYKTKSGDIFPGETNIFYLRDEAGKIEGFIGLIRNIAERQQSEKRLRRSEARLNSLVKNLFDAILVTDTGGVIQFANPAAHRLFGRQSGSLVGVHFGFPITLNERFEIKVNTSTGEVRYAEARATITEWNGEATYLISLRNVTERRLAREERDKMNAHLQQLQRIESIGTLAGGIAHDFNNILSPIMGFTELALDRVANDPVARESLDQVYRAGQRAKELVKQILIFSRQEQKDFQPVLLSPIAKEVLKMLRSTLPTTIEIRQDIASERIIFGDATSIHQILMNLCTNAKHAMAEKGGVLSVTIADIDLSAEEIRSHPELQGGEYVHLRVADTGYGIEPALLEKIFEPYFTTKEKEHGTGLGLSVTHGIVKDHGGAITVESTPGKGTVFDVYLPATKRVESLETASTLELQRGTERILLVDDEPPVVNLNQQILEKLGYEVATRTSSIEALALFKAKPASFDLLLTDMTMPKMTGDKLAVECRRLRPDLPVVLATGFSESLTEEKLAEIGVKALLYKPISKTEMASTIRNVLDDAEGKAQKHNRDAETEVFNDTAIGKDAHGN